MSNARPDPNLFHLLAPLIFTAIAIFLVIYTWLPARDSLLREDARVTGIIAQPNTWYEVELTTASGVRVTCRTRRGWPLAGPNRCPLEKFENLAGQAVNLMHDGKHPYEVAAGNQLVMAYSAHRQAQAIAFAIAGLMLAAALWAWRKK